MLRIRSTRLLSGVSALAVIAGAGLLTPALAAPTYTGPGVFTAIDNTESGAGATVTISTNAVILDDGFGVSFFNGKTMTGAGDKLAIDDSVLVGGIRNDGTMLSSDSDGIDIRNDSVIASGGIINNGLIEGGAGNSGIEVLDSVLIGDIVNNASRTIRGVANAISFAGDTVIVGSIINSGTIEGTAGDGVQMTGANVNFIGNITNNTNAVMTANGANFAAIDVGFPVATNSFVGNIVNSGTMQGLGGGSGIYIDTGTFVGDITNNSSGDITAVGAGANALTIWGATTFTGNIVNSGTVSATGAATADALWIGSTSTFTGNVTNNSGGLIQASDTALRIANTTFTGDVANTGRIISNVGDAVVLGSTTFTGNFTNNSGGTVQAADTAVLINAATFQGNFLNRGLIDATGTGAGLIVGSAIFNGDMTNSGTIRTNNGLGVNVNGGAITGNFINNGLIDSNSDDGVHISSTTFNGDFINNATGTIQAWSTGVAIQAGTFTGNFVNHGLIEGGLISDGVVISSATFTGNFTNDGSIVGDDNAVVFSGTTFTGDVLNDGYLRGPNDALRVNAGTTITGSITNGGETGIIISTAQDAVDINGIVNGLENEGSIIGFRDGIDVDGTVGSILNSGTVIGQTEAAIDLAGANGATTVTQTAGLIRGRTAGGTILDALDLVNGQADTYSASGGTLDGHIEGDAGDDMNVTNGLVYLRGTASNLTDVTKTGAGTFLLGAASRGDTGGEGVTVGGLNMFHNAGRVYVDDNTTVNMSNQYNQQPGTILEFYLTSDTTVHGQINAGGEGLFLDGQIAAFVNGTSFGAVGGDTFTYDDVMTGGVSGTFTNAADIITNSLFFEGEAIVNAADVDIVLHRLDFADALVLPGMTANETSVANVLDAIYALGPGPGGYGTDFSALFDYLLSLGAGDEALALALYNEISGEEHAQLQQTTLDILNPFNTFMGQRLDAARTTQNSVGFAAFGRQQQYAMASAVMSDSAPAMAPRSGAGVSIWARGYGQALNVDGDPEAPGYDQDTGGVVGGIDFMVGRASIIGVAGGWSTTEVDFNTPGDNADVDSFQVGAYGSTGFGRFYLDGEVAGAFHDLTTTRVLNLPTPPGGMVAGANYDARSLSAGAEFGAVWRAGNFLFQPNAGIAFTDVDTDTFIESGGGDFNLIVHGSDAQSLATTLGARFAGQFKAGGTSIIPELSLAWRHELDDDRQAFTAAFPDDPASTFNIVSSRINEDSALVEAGVTAGVTRNVELFLNYNGLINQDVDVHNGSAGLRATW